MVDAVSNLVAGRVDARFEPVRRELARNLRERGEVGAAVAVTVDGRLVVDCWGGLSDPKRNEPWREDTLVMVFSSTKGATSLAAHWLAAQGKLDLDLPIAAVWPEFARAGKETITTRMALSHRAGLPALDQPLPVEAAYDFARMTRALEEQAPHWQPGSAHGYHPFTFGWIIGEVVARCYGASLGSLLQRELAGPLGVELWVGLPEAYETRVARILPPPLPEKQTPMLTAMFDPKSLTARSFLNPMTFFAPKEPNSRAMRAAEIPAANGVGSARGLAQLYAALACGGSLGGVELLSRDACERLATVVSDGEDRVLLQRTRFSAGFMKSVETPQGSIRLGPNDQAFGHAGAGGSFGMADPVARVSIAYVMNRMGAGTLLNERGQALIDAVYESLAAPVR